MLGAHVREARPVTGTSFAVWAPNARGVRVSATSTAGTAAAYPMRSLGGSGVWELFVPGVGVGTRYKFAILGEDGVWREKADPMAPRPSGRPPPRRWSSPRGYAWGDAGGCGARRGGIPYGADERVRGAPRLVASRTRLPRAGRAARPSTWWTWASPTSSSCR